MVRVRHTFVIEDYVSGYIARISLLSLWYRSMLSTVTLIVAVIITLVVRLLQFLLDTIMI